MNPKQRAAEAAIAFVQNGMVVGLGTGSTANYFLRALSEALKTGKLRDVRGVPTSLQSDQHARELGIPLVDLAHHPHPDVTVDGCDEVDPNLDLIKGLGGALLREKVVAQNSRRFIIIADGSKRVATLGTRSPLPVEVAQFAYETHAAFFESLGATPILRRTPAGVPFVTDNQNYIYDCRFKQIDDPRNLEEALLHRAGIVDCGLFLGIAERALVAVDDGVIEMQRRPSPPRA